MFKVERSAMLGCEHRSCMQQLVSSDFCNNLCKQSNICRLNLFSSRSPRRLTLKQLSRGGCSAIHKDFLTGQFCPCLANVDHDVVVDLLLVVDRDVDFEW